MELIQKEAAWFLSDEGTAAFGKLTSLEDKSIFLYSYLKTVAKPEFDKDTALFKTAFLLADAVHSAGVAYSAYPAIIDPNKNPFVTYLHNATGYPGEKVLFHIYLAILHGLADVKNSSAWIYDDKLLSSSRYKDTLRDLEHDFANDSPVFMADPAIYETDAAMQTVQLAIFWLWGNKGGKK